MLEIHQELTTMAGDILQPDDMEKVRKYQNIMVELGQLQRDPFGLNPFLSDLETALIVTKEIGMTRGSILGVILNTIVLGGALTAEMVEKESEPMCPECSMVCSESVNSTPKAPLWKARTSAAYWSLLLKICVSS